LEGIWSAQKGTSFKITEDATVIWIWTSSKKTETKLNVVGTKIELKLQGGRYEGEIHNNKECTVIKWESDGKQ
jgi:hypothetical protein